VALVVAAARSPHSPRLDSTADLSAGRRTNFIAAEACPMTLPTTLEPIELPARGHSRPAEEHFSWILLALAIPLLTLSTVYVQEQHVGLKFVETVQLARHEAVLNGTAGNPWAYRVLSEYVAEGFLQVAGLLHVPHAVAAGFLAFRLVQNVLLFVFALTFYRLLGLTARESFIGMVLLAYAMTHSLENSDLSFNTYADVTFYLVAGCVVLGEWSQWWLMPISFLAALNRETSLMIPFMPVAALVASWGRNWRAFKQGIRIAVACFLIQLGTLLLLRVMIHPPDLPWQQVWGNEPGWPTLWMNLKNPFTMNQLALTLSVLPLAVLWNFRGLPAWLKGMFWIMVPAWFGIHLTMVYADETRIFLVPAAVVFIPGALYPRDRRHCGSAKMAKP
jgi:hypothetical protein